MIKYSMLGQHKDNYMKHNLAKPYRPPNKIHTHLVICLQPCTAPEGFELQTILTPYQACSHPTFCTPNQYQTFTFSLLKYNRNNFINIGKVAYSELYDFSNKVTKKKSLLFLTRPHNQHKTKPKMINRVQLPCR